MPRLPQNLRERAVGMLQAGMRLVQIARQLGTTSRTVRRLRERFNATGVTNDRPRSGRPRVTTRGQDRYIVTSHLRDRFMPAVVTARNTPGTHNNRISAQTVINRLRERGIRARRPYNGQVLTQRHRRQRLQWARRHHRLTMRDWQRVLFSDESRFTLSRSDGRHRVYRRVNEHYADACVEERDRFGGGASIMVWGGISHGQRTPLVPIRGNLNAVKYRDDILAPHVVPFLQANPNFTLQQDNATSHTARVTTAFLNANNVNVMPWPAKSPDINPIEHLWDALDRRVRKRQNQPRNLRELQNALVDEWNNIPQLEIQQLIRSMRQRCAALVNANGGHTRY